MKRWPREERMTVNALDLEGPTRPTNRNRGDISSVEDGFDALSSEAPASRANRNSVQTPTAPSPVVQPPTAGRASTAVAVLNVMWPSQRFPISYMRPLSHPPLNSLLTLKYFLSFRDYAVDYKQHNDALRFVRDEYESAYPTWFEDWVEYGFDPVAPDIMFPRQRNALDWVRSLHLLEVQSERDG